MVLCREEFRKVYLGLEWKQVVTLGRGNGAQYISWVRGLIVLGGGVGGGGGGGVGVISLASAPPYFSLERCPLFRGLFKVSGGLIFLCLCCGVLLKHQGMYSVLQSISVF